MMASEKLVALADQRKLDAVVRVLGIEDSEDDPSEVCRQIMDENERLHSALNLLWAEVVASGNSKARDHGWPKACAATRDALRHVREDAEFGRRP